MPTKGMFHCGDSVCFEAEALPSYATPCVVMELWIPARDVLLAAFQGRDLGIFGAFEAEEWRE